MIQNPPRHQIQIKELTAAGYVVPGHSMALHQNRTVLVINGRENAENRSTGLLCA
jgi:hypothetical protein